MNIIDGHSHAFQGRASAQSLKSRTEEIEGFKIDAVLDAIERIDVSLIQTMPQEMTRMRGQWLGSNELSLDLQRSAPERIVSFAAAEPLDAQDTFNKIRLEEIRAMVVEGGLKGLLLTPPYGHYYSNDRRVYPFYELAVELNFPIYFHHSHMFGSPQNCPLKYGRIWLLDDLTIDFPELRFNVEHMGYPWTEELLAIMSRSDNVFTDIAMYIDPYVGRARRLLLARNLGMAGEYGVLDRVFYGSRT
jgi:predicted TIM-barrel fold metal-dependent hydrolase